MKLPCVTGLPAAKLTAQAGVLAAKIEAASLS